ncbi:MAG UNVERIFIED_CONTAM: hypothetical protein LVT10_25495 [Anaerolineae bacterium]
MTASFHDGASIYLLVKDVPRSVWQAHGGKIIRKQGSIALEALRAWRGEAARRAAVAWDVTGDDRAS